MRLLDRIVRFLFSLLVVFWSAWLLRRFFGWIQQRTASIPPQGTGESVPMQTAGATRRLVRDPVCGMHVDEALAIPLPEDGKLLHFCSPACCDTYARTAKMVAANG